MLIASFIIKKKDKGSSKPRSRNHSMRGWAEIKCKDERTWRWCDRILIFLFFFSTAALSKIIHSNYSCLVVGKLQVNACWEYFNACSQWIYLALSWALTSFSCIFYCYHKTVGLSLLALHRTKQIKAAKLDKRPGWTVLEAFRCYCVNLLGEGWLSKLALSWLLLLVFFNWIKSVHTLITQTNKPPEQSACKRISRRHFASHERDSHPVMARYANNPCGTAWQGGCCSTPLHSCQDSLMSQTD